MIAKRFKLTILLCASLFVAVVANAQLLSQTTAEADARLVKAEGSPWEAGFKLTRCWAWVAGQAGSGNTMQELIVALNAVTNYTDPQANGKTYTGSFVNSEVWATDEATDGRADRHGMIFQTCTKVKAVTDVASMGTPFKNADRILLNFMEFNEGDQRHIWHMYTYLDPQYRDVAMALTPTESGYIIVKREFRTEKDRTGTLIVTFEQDTWSNQTGSSPNRIATITNTMTWANYEPKTGTVGRDVRRLYQGEGLMSNAVEEIMSNVTAESGYFLDNIRIAEKPNGEFGLYVDSTKARGTEDFYTVRWEAAYGNKPEREYVSWFWLTTNNAYAIYNDAKSNSAAMSSAFWRAAPANHRLDHIENNPMENGARRVDRVTYIPQSGGTAWPETTATYSNDYFRLSWDGIGTNTVVCTNYFFKLKKYEATVDAAEHDIDDWLTTNNVLKYVCVDFDVRHIGNDRWKAEADFWWKRGPWVVHVP